MSSGSGGRFSPLGWMLGRITADQPVEEKVTHNIETQVRIPNLQSRYAGIGAATIAVLFVAAWSCLPAEWVIMLPYVVTGVSLIAVSAWGARISHDESEFWQIVRTRGPLEVFAAMIFTKQFWALLLPLGLGFVTFKLHGLSDEWWSQNAGYAFCVALGVGPLVTSLMRIYLYPRETIVRFELTPWMKELLKAIRLYLAPAIEAELGIDVSGDRLERILDDFRREIYEALGEAGRLDRLADQATLQREGRAFANYRFRYDALSFLYTSHDPDVGLSRNNWVDARQAIGGEGEAILPSGLSVGYTEYTAILDTLAAAGIISRAQRKEPKINFDRLTRDAIADMIFGLTIDKLPKQMQDHYYSNST
uniref:Uncharacterized protein n=1 Tax=viral metagenome TaxID=1070528 RepID=A0A6H1ZXD9_9ZZZZ